MSPTMCASGPPYSFSRYTLGGEAMTSGMERIWQARAEKVERELAALTEKLEQAERERDNWKKESDYYAHKCLTIERERDEARATIERVKALVAEMCDAVV